MAWTNGPLVLYHGCDDLSASAIVTRGVSLTPCKPFTDFGLGFYTTTNFVQAKNWANTRCRSLLARSKVPQIATVIWFEVERDSLASLDFLTFVTENTNPDFWDFVRRCRRISPPLQHDRKGFAAATRPPKAAPRQSDYDVVFGPVTLWPQTLVIKDCDQISFHTVAGVACLPSARKVSQGRPLFP